MAAGMVDARWASADARGDSGRDTHGAQALAQSAAVDGSTGHPAGEQPRLVTANRGHRGCAVGFGEGDEVLAQRRRDPDRARPETELDMLAVHDDVVMAQAADAGRGLGVEDDEQPGDADEGVDARVVEQPPGEGPALVGADQAGDAARRACREVQGADQVLLAGPDQERTRVGPAGGPMTAQRSRTACVQSLRVRPCSSSQTRNASAVLSRCLRALCTLSLSTAV